MFSNLIWLSMIACICCHRYPPCNSIAHRWTSHRVSYPHPMHAPSSYTYWFMVVCLVDHLFMGWVWVHPTPSCFCWVSAMIVLRIPIGWLCLLWGTMLWVWRFPSICSISSHTMQFGGCSHTCWEWGCCVSISSGLPFLGLCHGTFR